MIELCVVVGVCLWILLALVPALIPWVLVVGVFVWAYGSWVVIRTVCRSYGLSK